MDLHADQLPISTATVHQLLSEQFPAWAGQPITRSHAEGTVHAIFRIGDQRVARFPLRAADPREVEQAIESEAAALTEVAEHLETEVPSHLATGQPGAGYPLPFGIWTWLPGHTATFEDPGDSTGFAQDLARVLRGLRAIKLRGRTFSGEGRGGDLHDHDSWLAHCFERSEGLLDVPQLQAAWEEFRELPAHAAESMNHGDLMPGNVLISEGRLSGLLDFATFGAADPSLDLVSAWHLLEREPRAVLRAALGSSDLEWARGQAWAFQQAMGLVWYYRASNLTLSRIGRRTLERIMAARRLA